MLYHHCIPAIWLIFVCVMCCGIPLAITLLKFLTFLFICFIFFWFGCLGYDGLTEGFLEHSPTFNCFLKIEKHGNSSMHETYCGTAHMLGHKTSLSKCRKTEITPCIFTHDHGMKLEMNNSRNIREYEQHVTEWTVSHRRNQRQIWKTSWKEWKWRHNVSTFIKYKKSSINRGVQ